MVIGVTPVKARAGFSFSVSCSTATIAVVVAIIGAVAGTIEAGMWFIGASAKEIIVKNNIDIFEIIIWSSIISQNWFD